MGQKPSLHFALVYPPFDDKRDRAAYYVAPPLGILYIAAALEAAGHKVTVYDFILDIKTGRLPLYENMYRACAERILGSNPDVVGFSTQCSTSPPSVNIAKLLKEMRPQSSILFGGHDVSFLARDYLDTFPFIDFVLAGEAEITAPKLAEAIYGKCLLSSIAGLGYRDEGKVKVNSGAEFVEDLDSLPPPSYHLVPDLKEYFSYSQRPTILIDSGRGCLYSCEFCQTSRLSGGRLRHRSTGSIIAELRRYKSLFTDFEAYFVHDLFNAKRRFVEELCRAMIKENLGLNWQCRCRLDLVDKELLELMGRAGCTMLLYGVESGSEKVLRVLNKRLKPGTAYQQVERTAWTVEAKIFPSLSMVVGEPEETFDDLDQTLRLAAEFIKMGKVNSFIQLMSPLPGTPFSVKAIDRLEYRQDVPTAFSRGIEFLQGCRLLEDEELIRSWPRIFQCFYTVVPDHNDLDICVDISVIYCKLLEVYCHTYLGLAQYLNVTLLELFRSYCDFLRNKRQDNNLRDIRDFEIWDGFWEFTSLRFNAIEVPDWLREVMRYEKTVHEIAVSPPVDSVSGSEAYPRQKRFRLVKSARFYKAKHRLSWMSDAGSKDCNGERSFLIFMTQDRLQIIQLQPEWAAQFELLEELNRLNHDRPESYSGLFTALKPFFALGVFEFVSE